MQNSEFATARSPAKHRFALPNKFGAPNHFDAPFVYHA
jgi:hypothetical protein